MVKFLDPCQDLQKREVLPLEILEKCSLSLECVWWSFGGPNSYF